MKIGIIGLGYVGMANAAYFLCEGHDIIAIDKDTYKIVTLEDGKFVLPEPGIAPILKKYKDHVTYSTNPDAISSADVIFVCVNTPEGTNWETNMSHFNEAKNDILKYAHHQSLVIIKSTVPCGTTREFQKALKKYRPSGRISVVFSPEFLRQGHALADIKKPSRLVFGIDNEDIKPQLEELYKNVSGPRFYTDFNSAELAKYASNAFLALKISYANEISNIANKNNANMNDIIKIMSLDKRISPEYLNPGIGFGGGCFVKDSKSLVSQAKDCGVNAKIVRSIIERNEEQSKLFLTLFDNKPLKSMKHKKILFVGVAFKGDSGDVRNSIAIQNLKTLEKSAPHISLYDPLVNQDDMNKLKHPTYEDLNDAIRENDVIVIFNEKKEILKIKPALFKGKYVLDGRNILKQEQIGETTYYFSPALGEIYKR